MKYFGENGLSHLISLIKNTFAAKEHKHTISDVTDYKEYELPTASSDTLGGIKIGSGLSINQGVVSVNAGGIADSVDWSGVQNKPITISGYGITDANISSQTITLGGSSLTVPTNTNQLTNGAGFITSSAVPTNNNQLTNGAGYQTASDVATAISNSLSSVMTYKGTVANYSDLPSNANVGDTYNITNASNNNKAGDNAAWNGTSWDILSGTIDLSGYIQSTDLTEMPNTDIDTMWASAS